MPDSSLQPGPCGTVHTRVQPTRVIETLRPYVAASPRAARLAGSTEVLWLDANEPAAPPSPLVVERLEQLLASGELNRYPDPAARDLRRRLSAYTGRPVSQIQVFNGSDSALDYTARTFASAGDHVVICAPCYDNFRVSAESLGARVEEVFARDPFTVDVWNLIAHLTPRTRLVYVCNPNNPTGRLYKPDEIAHILECLRGGVLIVDEAYFEYCGVTVSELVGQHPNLIVVRSFSKAFGLASLRCGYVLADEQIIRYLDRIRNVKDVNVAAQVAAAAALDDVAYMREQVANIGLARQWLVEALRAMDVDVVPAPANFVMIRVDDPPRITGDLAREGVYIRDRSCLPQLEHYVRVTIGSFDECRRFIEALTRVCGRLGPKAPHPTGRLELTGPPASGL